MKRLAAAVTATCLVSACRGRPRAAALDGEGSSETASPTADQVIEFDLSDGVPESKGSGFLFPLPAAKTYAGLVRDIDRAAKNPAAKGYFIRLGDAQMGWAHAEELGLAFEHLREKSGKPVVCHADALDNKSAWFTARACSRIWLSPAGDLDTVGIAGQVIYLKGALDKLKVRADFLHMGRYKSAAETLTQEGPTPEARESLTAVLGSIRSTWLESYGSARKGDAVKSLEDGPFSPGDGRTRGLIDAIGYESEARKEAKTLAHAPRTVVAFGNKKTEPRFDVSEILRTLAGAEGGTKRPHIAVITAEGSIAMGGSGSLSSSGITASGLERVIRRIADDDTVKAVVLRIDSPGGSALASDLLWHELMELRKKKPVVASVGDMAASGGYYLACAANKIVAPRTSIVGSIGVLGGKIVIDEALAQVGVHAETFPANPGADGGTRASYMSALSPWDDATRARVRAQMADVYELFLRRVAEGRGLPVDAVRAVAEGRIWSGVQGQQLRLVDELGGLGRALNLARQLGSLGPDAPVSVEGESSSLVENFFSHDDDESRITAPEIRSSKPSDVLLARAASSLKPFIGALTPLLEGESAVAALPFAFELK